MPNKCPNIGIGLALLATGGILYTVASKYWKQNSQVSSENFVMGLQSYQGIWVRCVSPEPGRFNCDYYDVSYLGLPVFLQVLRGMMCLAAICSAAGVFAGLLGLECVSALEDGSKSKLWSGRCGGILMLLAGSLCLVSVSWYAADIIYNFTLSVDRNDTFVYEFGSALYVGWVASFFALLSGIMLTCCNCGSQEEARGTSDYYYKPNKPTSRSAEYV